MTQLNQILITIDSCRWDTFERAKTSFLKSGPYEKCATHGTFTMAAHHAFFAGKLPHSYSGRKFFDTAALSKRRKKTQKRAQ